MHEAVIHLGHCFRKRGATGTAGWGHSEQDFTSTVGYLMEERLKLRGVDAVAKLADEALPRAEIFMALHQDGSTNAGARGASVGYPVTQANKAIAGLWKALYTQAGWPSGFRGDNYTRALRTYYGFRRINADVKFLVEHGFATNRTDQTWMWDNLSTIVDVNCNTIIRWLGVVPSPAPFLPSLIGEDVVPIHDPKAGNGAGQVFTIIDSKIRVSSPKSGQQIPIYPDYAWVLLDYVAKKSLTFL